ncbi:MAG: tryptophan synthase subunit beta [Cyanobacteria bacterium RYN_339]|nr:tryptophan synthase subunit beta [Cyanobacteria bacterium RYN_339]
MSIHMPDAMGHFGEFGGRYVAETLMPAVRELDAAWQAARQDAAYLEEYHRYLRDYVGRPSLLYEAKNLAAKVGKARVFLKREDLNHTGAHKINNCIGQILLAKRMGKTRIIAETGAGQHGVATATVAALFGLQCIVYMGRVDTERQALNVARMNLLGAEVRPVDSGAATLKDAMNEAMRDWVTNVGDTYYLIGSVGGPHPYPQMVRDLQAIIGQEARAQMLDRIGRLPSHVLACVGGGSNAMGIFHAFLGDADVKLFGVEPAGEGIESGRHGATLSHGRPGVFHGSHSYVLQDAGGQIQEAHSISAGLDYPGVGPEHSYLKDAGRARYEAVTDEEALEGVKLLSRSEGIIPALESAHAIAYLQQLGPTLSADDVVLLNLSGRGDKDMVTIAARIH